jgi:hypothetical protein
MARVLLDFSNLRVGGGVQVASATLQDLTTPAIRDRYAWLTDATIRLSTKVSQHLSFEPSSLPGKVEIVDTWPTALALFRYPRRSFDVRFTLFGPTYTGRLARREIMGFAEVTLVYAPTEYGMSGRDISLRDHVGRAVKHRLVRNADVYVTETSAIAARLASRHGILPQMIAVVPNRPHPMMSSRLAPTRMQRLISNELHLLYPTRAYLHKNLAIIDDVGTLYRTRTGRRLIVHTTLKKSEWETLPPAVRRWMFNHDEVTPDKLAALYENADAVFFPSLLEACSATPLEANAMGVPLIASDRDFVTSSARPQVVFDPQDPVDIVEALRSFDDEFSSYTRQAIGVSELYRDHLTLSNRTKSYLDLVESEF